MQSRKVPLMWKLYKNFPVHKKIHRHLINNHRPISIICNFYKVFKMLLKNKISLDVSNLISIDRHGLIKGSSTDTNLFEIG